MSMRTDITKRKELEAQILQASKMAALGEMAAGVAHEINNPLAILTMTLEQMNVATNAANTQSPDLKKFISRMQKTSERIDGIVKGLKTFARDGADQPKTIANIHQLIEETLLLCKEKFSTHGVKLTVEKDDIPNDLCLPCNSIQITQVLINLLNNAFDAIQGFEEKWIRLCLEVDTENLNIIVTDCGHGIPKEIINKIMEPFFTTKKLGCGTGLGLSISRGIVAAHQGHFFANENCKNTQFILRLPLRIVDVTAEVTVESQTRTG